jgi:hypothetical protein
MVEKLIRAQTKMRMKLKRKIYLRKHPKEKKQLLKSKSDLKMLLKKQLNPTKKRKTRQQSQMIKAMLKVKVIKNTILTTISSLRKRRRAPTPLILIIQTIRKLEKIIKS